MKRNKRLIIGGSIIAATILAMSLLSLQENSVYFFTPDEAQAKAGELQHKEIRIGGMVKAGSVNWQAEAINLGFVLTDFKTAEIQVTHQGTPPDMFKENSGVVVEGRLDPSGKNFVAKQLFVKHSEEYKVPTETHSMDKALLEKSMFGTKEDAL